jgi:formate C-acetyltransferase
MRYGGGMLAVYNEDLIISAMVKHGYALEEARQFANDGCWEVQVPGKTYFIYCPFDALEILQQKTLGGYVNAPAFESFEELYAAYVRDLREKIEYIEQRKHSAFEEVAVPSKDWKWKKTMPCTPVSLFEEGCVERGLSYLGGGPIYNVISPHIGGLADVVNSLYAIRCLVYEEKKVTFSELMRILASDWEGEEALRQYVSRRYEYYGNDNEAVDSLLARLVADHAKICEEQNGKSGYTYHAGISTFGRQLEWAPHRLATPYGKRAGEVLAANASPSPGTDRAGATAIIRSYCAADWSDLPVGAALDLKLLPSSVEGESGLSALVGLLRGFVTLGGFFLQPDVVDAAVLREAQEHPEDYDTLSVRVSGWNARFVTLNREWQDMVIAQNEK